MELVTLNANKQPDKMVEGWDGLIWAERFNTVGDFQLITGDVDRFMDLYPQGTLLSLRESTAVAEVETRKIERKKNVPAKLTITGRMWESILDRRVSINTLTPKAPDWVVNAKTPSDVAYYIINMVCVSGIVSVKDIFPVSQVQFPAPSDYLASTGPTRAFTVPRGRLLDTVLQMLQTEAKQDATTVPITPAVVPHGIRSVRPNAAGTAVAIQIYVGVDRSTGPNAVRFEATRDALDDGTYLFSKVGSADVAYILGTNTSMTLSKKTVEPSGFDRRVTLVDGTGANITDSKALQNQGEQSLAEAKETAIFDGSLNQDLASYTYGVHYNLGDIVSLVGDYGLVQKARVTEYIRSEDSNGEKAYPTLVTID